MLKIYDIEDFVKNLPNMRLDQYFVQLLCIKSFVYINFKLKKVSLTLGKIIT